ncbi:hypothetical protein Q3A66_16975 [Hymenobacter sp. BT770]|uniref:hypothetical protein n=1 Tax=Hymenobacter sp. BT770 TaxID=2886942 RepID=UPI001D10E07A|nr:hypothetical protein [Hymenobacter sp. BT770]MCC3154860.1 hypothetical protein [Hymenobacter sp. BT770]MDO3416765.1 hypothetical protein [Hymenobacter sp. BT770]
MYPRTAALRFLPAALLLLTACSESNTKTETVSKTAPAAEETMASTAAAIDSTKPATPAPAAPRPNRLTAPDTAYAQDVASFLGGQRPSQHSDLTKLAEQPAWQAFAADQDKSWAKYRATHTTSMTKWASTELDEVHRSSPTIFYPFSGPDFLNVFTMFPTSQTYVLMGLEPVGSVPARASLENPKLFPAVKASLWSVLNFSFFRTNDMAVDLKSVELDGALPLMMLFAARTGNLITAIRPVQLDASGQLTDAPTDTTQAAHPKSVPGVEMKLRGPDGQPKTVYYFSTDLSNHGLQVKPAPIQFVRSLGPLTTYVKSATYLMHKLYFSEVRRLVLRHSRYILQDDSGIAMKFFQKGAWQFNYYGTYKRPINLFAKHYQPELTAAYTDTLHRPKALPFGTGYNWRQTDSNLLLARRLIPLAD